MTLETSKIKIDQQLTEVHHGIIDSVVRKPDIILVNVGSLRFSHTPRWAAQQQPKKGSVYLTHDGKATVMSVEGLQALIQPDTPEDPSTRRALVAIVHQGGLSDKINRIKAIANTRIYMESTVEFTAHPWLVDLFEDPHHLVADHDKIHIYLVEGTEEELDIMARRITTSNYFDTDIRFSRNQGLIQSATIDTDL